MKNKTKKTIFMTGATGHMGLEALKLFVENRDLHLKILTLADKTSRKILKPYRSLPNVEIIEGDLRNIDDIRLGVKGADYVLHVGAIIPPAADRYPELSERVNLGGTLNIIKAIWEQDDPDNIRLVYISTVASMGYRKPSIHWGRMGDPIKVSKFDAYSVSKVKAERAVLESGLKYWVCLRQSGMLHRDMLKLIDPIIFHQPLNNHIEWSTAEDSGRALYNLCVKNLSSEFWKNTYNIGSGPEFRVTYYEFLKSIFKVMGVKDIHKIFNPRDFVTQNFHCVWYSDSDKLNEWLDFQRSTFESFWKTVDVPPYYQFMKIVPSWLMRKMVLEPMAHKDEGTRNWIENNRSDKIKAYWGSREVWENISEDWADFESVVDPPCQTILHGYNEEKAPSALDLNDCRQAADFRGGKCHSHAMTQGNLYEPLEWTCAAGHKFSANPNTVLKSGHWCPVCDTDTDNYAYQARNSRFFAQVHDG